MKKTKKLVSSTIPALGLNLAKYSGSQLIDRLGDSIIREVVTSILCGGNVRALTEGLTQRRVSLSNASLLIAFLKSINEIPDFEKKYSAAIINELKTAKLSNEQRVYLQWLIGLTGKGIQNVLRSDAAQFNSYLNSYEDSLKNSIKQAKEEYGTLTANIKVNDINHFLNWPLLLRLFTALGSQTLAIRGSEKSMYGKLFEKLILGSVLSLLGFKYINFHDSTESKMVFWLSQREDKRESDATILIKPGIGVRFDIGFIGPGNTEISLDKVTRFEKELEQGKTRHYMSTLILVDRIGEGSRITELAKSINANIVQMSMSVWVKEVCQILKEKANFNHPLLKMSESDSFNFIQDKMKLIDLKKFLE